MDTVQPSGPGAVPCPSAEADAEVPRGLDVSGGWCVLVLRPRGGASEDLITGLWGGRKGKLHEKGKEGTSQFGWCLEGQVPGGGGLIHHPTWVVLEGPKSQGSTSFLLMTCLKPPPASGCDALDRAPNQHQVSDMVAGDLNSSLVTWQ